MSNVYNNNVSIKSVNYVRRLVSSSNLKCDLASYAIIASHLFFFISISGHITYIYIDRWIDIGTCVGVRVHVLVVTLSVF